MEELIYENSTFSGNRQKSDDFEDNENSYEDIYMNAVGDTQVDQSNKITTTSASGPSTAGLRCYRLAVMCLLILVVLLLAAMALLWVNFNDLTVDKAQLETSYNNLTMERYQSETRYKKLAEERDQFQRKRDELQKTLSQLKEDINTPGWRYFNSRVYYISTEKKSWSESRDDCRRRGADLVIIKHKEEQDFVDVWRRGEIAWIGANDSETEGTWTWVDGTAVTNGFWNDGEPNNVGDEDCAVIGYGSNAARNWVDVSCNRENIGICEKRINS